LKTINTDKKEEKITTEENERENERVQRKNTIRLKTKEQNKNL